MKALYDSAGSLLGAFEEITVGESAVEAGGVSFSIEVLGPGWRIDDNYTPAPAREVPQSVTRRQAKAALLLTMSSDGTTPLLNRVQSAIDAITDATQRALIQIEWDESLYFERTRPTLIAMGAALGLDAAGLDTLFILAGKQS